VKNLQSSKYLLIISNVIVYAFLLLPLLVIIGISFSPTYGMTFPPEKLSLRWFKFILDQKEFIQSFYVSLVVAFFTSLFALTFGVLVSLAIVRYNFRWKTVIENIFMMPVILPSVVVGIAILQFFSIIGYYNFWMRLIIAHIIITIPYTIRSISSCLYGFNTSLEEASLIMGANHLQTFKNVLAPLIKPGIIAGALLSFIISFDNITVSLFLIGSRTVTLPVRIMLYLEWNMNPSVAAISAILIALTVITIIIAEKIVGLGNMMRIE
jgi:putative spermidine/putrescine transport system permease protein